MKRHQVKTPLPHKDQNGFSAIEAVLVVVIVVAIAGVGWFVWHSKQTADKTLTASSSTEPTFKRRPKSSSTSATTQSTKQTQSLYPADAATPASGVCGQVSGTRVIITANLDLPSPTCAQVSPSQSLTVTNGTTQTINVTFASYQFSVAPGASHNISASFGSYLKPGVHFLKFGNLYTGSNAEVWLKQ